MHVAVCIPYRPTDEYRERAFEYVRRWWEQFDYPISVSPGPEGLMNRAAARNQAAAGEWNVAVFADADTIAQPELIQPMVDRAVEGMLSYPATRMVGLSKNGTQKLLDGGIPGPRDVILRRVGSPGGILAVSRDLFEQVGGYDEGFIGWGYEDLAFAWAAKTFGGEHREEGVITHLWHPKAPEKPDHIKGKGGNKKRKERYLEATSSHEAMRALIDEWKCSRS